jgi:uncharacterized protein (DUF1810 family)
MQGGRKHTHWIWWVFPQVSGLGSSYRAKKYAIQNLQEATLFLEDSVLGVNYREITAVVYSQVVRNGVLLRTLFGAPDDRKFISSITLFQRAGKTGGPDNFEFLGHCEEILDYAEKQGFNPCERSKTLSSLRFG